MYDHYAHNDDDKNREAIPDQLKLLNDADLELVYGNTLADYALAEKYEHNARLRPLIRARIDAIWAEQERRGSHVR